MAYSRGILIVSAMPEWKKSFLGLYSSIENLVKRNGYK